MMVCCCSITGDRASEDTAYQSVELRHMEKSRSILVVFRNFSDARRTGGGASILLPAQSLIRPTSLRHQADRLSDVELKRCTCREYLYLYLCLYWQESKLERRRNVDADGCSRVTCPIPSWRFYRRP